MKLLITVLIFFTIFLTGCKKVAKDSNVIGPPVSPQPSTEIQPVGKTPSADDFRDNPTTSADLGKEINDIDKELGIIEQEMNTLDFDEADETVPSLE